MADDDYYTNPRTGETTYIPRRQTVRYGDGREEFKTVKIETDQGTITAPRKLVGNVDSRSPTKADKSFEVTQAQGQSNNLQSKTDVSNTFARNLYTPASSEDLNKPIRTLDYQTNVPFRTQKGVRKFGRDIGYSTERYGSLQVTEDVNIQNPTTTRTTTTNLDGDVTITRSVTPKITLNPNVNNLPKPPTDYELIGGGTGRSIKSLDEAKKELRNKRENLGPESRFDEGIKLRVQEEGLEAAQYIVALPKRSAKLGAEFLFTRNKQNPVVDAYKNVVGEDSPAVFVSSKAFEVGALGTTYARVQSGAISPKVKVSETGGGGFTRTNVKGLESTQVRQNFVAKIETPITKSGLIVPKSGGVKAYFQRPVNTKTLGVQTATQQTVSGGVVKSQTIARYLDPVSKTSTIPQTVETSKGLVRGKYTIEQVKGVQGVSYRISTGERIKDLQNFETIRSSGFEIGKSSLSQTSSQGVITVRSPETIRGPLATKSQGLGGISQNAVKNFVISGKRGQIPLGLQSKLVQPKTIQPTTNIANPILGVSRSSLSSFQVVTPSSSGTIGLLALAQNQQTRPITTLQQNNIQLQQPKLNTSQALLPIQSSLNDQIIINRSTTTPRTTTTNPQNLLNPPSSPLVPANTSLTPPPVTGAFGLDLGGSSNVSLRKSNKKLSQKLATTPLIYSGLKGTARKGVREGFFRGA